MSELEALHFLRPAWLLGVPVILLLGFWAGWRQRAERLWRGRIASRRSRGRRGAR